MEDTYGFVVDFDAVRGQGLFAIFDGHGNKSAAEWCGAEFYTVCFYIMDSFLSQLAPLAHPRKNTISTTRPN
jgi:serine/threonine protein phosphatase PrpC